MIGLKVEYKKESSRFGTFTGTVLDKVQIKGTDYYLIKNQHTNEVDRIYCYYILKVL